ncbi:hypothetical protein Tco_1306156, partial [Tanacetum coccineum]
ESRFMARDNNRGMVEAANAGEKIEETNQSMRSNFLSMIVLISMEAVFLLVMAKLKGHQKQITGLAFSELHGVLVSSGVDALERRAVKLDRRADALDRRFNALERRLDALGRRVQNHAKSQRSSTDAAFHAGTPPRDVIDKVNANALNRSIGFDNHVRGKLLLMAWMGRNADIKDGVSVK